MLRTAQRWFIGLLLLSLLTACGGSSTRVHPGSDLIKILGGGFPIDVQKREAQIAVSLSIVKAIDGPVDIRVTFPNPVGEPEVQTVTAVPDDKKEFHLTSKPVKGLKTGVPHVVSIIASDKRSGETLYQMNQPLYLSLPPGVTID